LPLQYLVKYTELNSSDEVLHAVAIIINTTRHGIKFELEIVVRNRKQLPISINISSYGIKFKTEIVTRNYS
jgi:hypothetical protein